MFGSHVLIVLSLFFTITSSVDRSNFRLCSQSGFCKRQRGVQPNQSPYIILMDSMRLQQSSIYFQLLNTKNNVRLSVQLDTLQSNTARLKINEVSPIKPRFEIPIGDVLVGEPRQQDLKVLGKDQHSITIGFQQNKIRVTAEPFRVDFIVDEDPVISINARGLLKFEHLRTKTDEPQEDVKEDSENEEKEGEGKEQEDGEGENPDDKPDEEEEKPVNTDDEPDMWEETFKSFHDTKPNGPTSVGLDVSFPGSEHVYGIPEHADSLALKTTTDGEPYRLYNLDVFEYELGNPMALYGSVPFMIAHNERKTVGMFWHNAAETFIDIKSDTADKNFLSKIVDLVKGDSDIPEVETHWFSESGIIDVFLLLGPDPDSVFYQYTQLTGTQSLPPLFAIAYHQSRWNYNDENDVKTVDANFDQYDIPYDVLWLDIEHTDGKRYFTWDSGKFPTPKDMLGNLAAKGRKMVTIIDPHIKRDDNYKIYSEAKSKDYFVKNKDGGEYEGWCWPGSSSWLDYLNPEIRRWWASRFDLNEYEGSTETLFTWNDMNEPSVFNGPEITMHKDAKHYGGWEHRDVHNIFGLYQHRATTEGLLMRSNGKLRPFVLTRAFFAGTQRYGAVWTGDNTAEWSHLKYSMPMLLSMQVAGITFSGADVGGFFKSPDNELLTRWYQAAAYQPFFRAHAHVDTRRREPWLLPDENSRIVRNSIRARYSLLPFWYTNFRNSERQGSPVMRPLWVEFTKDKTTYNMEDQYLIGRSLLVKPITDAGATGTNVYFPGKTEIWYDVENYMAIPGGETRYVAAPLDKIPVYQRGGYIIPRKERIRRSSSLSRNDPFTLIVCLDQQGTATGDLYVDDYHTLNYRSGEFQHRLFVFKNNKLENRNIDANGKHKTKEWLERVVVVGITKAPVKIKVKSIVMQTEDLQFTFHAQTNILVIRKPGVNIAEDWTIELS